MSLSSPSSSEPSVQTLLNAATRIADRHRLKALIHWKLIAAGPLGLDIPPEAIKNLGILQRAKSVGLGPAIQQGLKKRRSGFGRSSPTKLNVPFPFLPVASGSGEKTESEDEKGTPEVSQTKSKVTENKAQKGRARELWKLAFRKITMYRKAFNAQMLTQLKVADELEVSHAGYLPQRFVDYFLVFGLCPPENLENVDFSKLSAEQAEKVLSETDLFAGLSDRYPLDDYKDFPVDLSWTSFAFPTGLVLSWERRPARFHATVLTDARGVHCYASFLQFDQPLSSVFGKKDPSDTPAKRARSKKTPPAREFKAHKREIYLPRAICLISHYPFFPEFRKILCQFFSVAQDVDNRPFYPVELLIKQVVREVPLPVAGKAGLEFVIQRNSPVKVRFDNIRHPLTSRIPLHLLFEMLSIDSILGVIAAMMCERRIMLHSSSLSSLTTAAQCFLQLLYPFSWCSVFIPVVPEPMLAVYQYPQPYIQGVHTKYLSQLEDFGDIVLVDLDQDVIRSTVSLPKLPQKAGTMLMQSLQEVEDFRITQRDVVLSASFDPWDPDSESSKTFDSGVYEAFTVFYGQLFSGYRRFVFFIDGVPVMNFSSFLKFKAVDETLNSFLPQVVQTRMFDNFLLHQHEEASNSYIEYISSETRKHLDDIRRSELQSIKFYRITDPEQLKVEQSANVNMSPNHYLCPFLEPLQPELLKPVRKYRLKMKNRRYESMKRSPHLEDQIDIDEKQQVVRNYVQKIFTGKSIDGDEQTKVEALLSEQTTRMRLADILRQPSHKYSNLCLSQSSFRTFISLILAMLKNCTQSNDLRNASAVLLSTSKFYCDYQEGTIEKRRFVCEQKEIRYHQMWRNPKFWDVCLDEHVRTTTASLNRSDSDTELSRASTHSETFDLDDMEKEPDKPRENEIAVQWLIQSVPQMFQFGLKSTEVEKLVFALARKHGASGEDLKTLKVLVENVARVEIA